MNIFFNAYSWLVILLVVNCVQGQTVIETGKGDSIALRKNVQTEEKVDTLKLSEVVVSTGLQRISKERATGSFDYISRQEFDLQVGSDVMGRLEALANGYMNNRRPGLVTERPIIRGLGTLNGPTDPLIILDNFPYEGDINQLNPNDIEDISILKDAAATSIWGARAANGVIVIRSRKAEIGEPFTATFTANYSIAEKPDLFYLQQMSPGDFIDVEKMLYKEGYYESLIQSPYHLTLTPVQELLLAYDQDNSLSIQSIEKQIADLKQYDVRSDFERYIYRPSHNQQYALNVQGSGKKTSWYAMAGYDRNSGHLQNTYERVSLRMQQQYQISKNSSLNGAIRYTSTQQRGGKFGYNQSFPGGIYPYARFVDKNGLAAALYPHYRRSFVDKITEEGALLDWNFIPLLDDVGSENRTSTSDLLIDLSASTRIIPGVRIEASYQFEQQLGDGRVLQGLNRYATRHLINSFTSVQSDGSLHHAIPVGAILDQSSQRLLVHQGRFQVDFQQSWDKHELVALLGTELRHRRARSDRDRIYGYDPDNLTFGLVDFTHTYPNYVTGAHSFVAPGVALDDFVNRFASVFANGAYTFDNRYALTFSGRRDASNLFGLNTNDQWNLFWSTGLAWHVSNEQYYQSQWLPYLKIRATLGMSGNVDPTMVAVNTVAYTGTNSFTGTPFAQVSNYYNPDLRWESIRMFNLGIDFRSRNGSLAGSVEYFSKRGTDLFGRTLIDYTAGVGESIVKNAGSMSGEGVDVQLQANFQIGMITWRPEINFSYYADKVEKNEPLSEYASSYLTGQAGTTGLFAKEGRPVNAVFAYPWAGLNPMTGDPQGILQNEVSSDYAALTAFAMPVDDLVYIGTAVPKYFGALNQTVSYKRLSLSVSMVYQLGHYFRRHSIDYYNLYRDWSGGHSDFSKRWQKPGDEQYTDVPSMVFPAVYARDQFYTRSEALIEKGDNLRLQFVRLGYSFNKLNLFLLVTNPGILWKATKTPLDPHAVGTYDLPTPTSYTVGIKSTF